MPPIDGLQLICERLDRVRQQQRRRAHAGRRKRGFAAGARDLFDSPRDQALELGDARPRLSQSGGRDEVRPGRDRQLEARLLMLLVAFAPEGDAQGVSA